MQAENIYIHSHTHTRTVLSSSFARPVILALINLSAKAASSLSASSARTGRLESPVFVSASMCVIWWWGGMVIGVMGVGVIRVIGVSMWVCWSLYKIVVGL